MDEQKELQNKAKNAAALQEQIQQQQAIEEARQAQEKLIKQQEELAGIEKEKVQKQVEAGPNLTAALDLLCLL